MIFLFAQVYVALQPAITQERLLDAIKHIPSEASLYTDKPVIGGYELGKDVKTISKVITEQAKNVHEAIEDAVYAAYESGFDLDAIGDKKRTHWSFGAWQIPFAGMDAAHQLAYWSAARSNSVAACSHNSEDTRMAALASGHCDRALKKVGKRAGIINRLTEEFQ